MEKNYKRLFSDNFKLKSEKLGEDYKQIREAFNPGSLKKLLRDISRIIKARTGLEFTYSGRETLKRQSKGNCFVMKYYNPKVELRFLFTSKFGEQVESIDVLKSGKTWNIDCKGFRLVNKLKEVSELIKTGKSRDPEVIAKPVVEVDTPILSPQEQKAQSQFEEWRKKENDLEEIISRLKMEVNDIISGVLTATLVSGVGGVGKTHTITQILEDQVGSEGSGWVHIAGGSLSAPTLVDTLGENNGKIIVFDDVMDEILLDKGGAVNVLKGALQTKKSSRKVTWKGREPFVFTGSIIIVTNMMPEKIFKGPAAALGDRMTSIEFIVSEQEVLGYVNNILQHLAPSNEDYTMSENDKMKCFEFFKEAYTHYKSYRRFGYISIRSLVRTFDYYIASSNSGGNWQQRSVSSA